LVNKGPDKPEKLANNVDDDPLPDFRKWIFSIFLNHAFDKSKDYLRFFRFETSNETCQQ
jgi:hypothetical protein